MASALKPGRGCQLYLLYLLFSFYEGLVGKRVNLCVFSIFIITFAINSNPMT